MESEPMLTPREKSPLPEKNFNRVGLNPWRKTASSTHYQRAIPAPEFEFKSQSGPKLVAVQMSHVLQNTPSMGTSANHQSVTRGVTVSMSAFLACHQCYCAGLSLAWGLNLWAVVCGIFWSSSPGVFSGYSGFLPSFIGLIVQPIK